MRRGALVALGGSLALGPAAAQAAAPYAQVAAHGRIRVVRDANGQVVGVRVAATRLDLPAGVALQSWVRDGMWTDATAARAVHGDRLLVDRLTVWRGTVAPAAARLTVRSRVTLRRLGTRHVGTIRVGGVALLVRTPLAPARARPGTCVRAQAVVKRRRLVLVRLAASRACPPPGAAGSGGGGGTVAVPVEVTLPAISGTPQSSKTVTAGTGTWSGSPTSYGYRWLRCDASGAGCVDIAGAASRAYTCVPADIDHRLRVAVTATNAGGTSPAAVSAAAPKTLPS